MAKIIVHLGTGTYFGLDDGTYIIDTQDMGDEFDPDTFEADMEALVEQYGTTLRRGLRDTIPCSGCGKDVWDDGDNAHVATGSYNCSTNFG